MNTDALGAAEVQSFLQRICAIITALRTADTENSNF